MEWIKKNGLTVLLFVGIVYIIFANNTTETELNASIEDLRKKHRYELRIKENRIKRDSIRYEAKLDTLHQVNNWLYYKLNKNKEDYQNEKEHFQSITSDSSFIYINDSIERFILSM